MSHYTRSPYFYVSLLVVLLFGACSSVPAQRHPEASQPASLAPAMPQQHKSNIGTNLDGDAWKALVGPGTPWSANPSNVDWQTDEEYSPEAESAGEELFELGGPPLYQPPISEREALGDQPTQRYNYWADQRAYPLDTLPEAGFANAAMQMQAMMAVQAAGEVPAWQNIGPAPMIGSLMGQQKVDVSGRVLSIAINKRNSNVVYIGTALGGVWKTTNGGDSWTPLTDKQPSLAINALALDPNNPDIVYAGTGEQNSGIGSYYGAGLLKSTDGGQSWVLLGANVFRGAAIAKVIVDPANSNVLYVASGNSGINGVSTPPLGIFKSTDGGQSWTALYSCTKCQGANDMVLYSRASLTNDLCEIARVGD